MKVTVHCFGAMREYLPDDAAGGRADLELSDDATVGDLVDSLGAPRGLVHTLLIDGERADLDRNLTDGSEVTLMPPFTGGAVHQILRS